MKYSFIKNNLLNDGVIGSTDCFYHFLGKRPENYRRLGIVPVGTEDSYHPKEYNLQGSFVIVTEYGYEKPNKYQQKLIKKYLL